MGDDARADLRPEGRADDLLEGLDEAQRAAVTGEQIPLAILAGPGAGKTRVLTRRIAWRVATGKAEATKVLAVTFTRKAAGELTTRLGSLGVGRDGGPGVTAGTLHAVALAQLRRRAAERDRPMPALLERKVRLLLPLVGGRGPAALVAAADLASEIEWAKARLVTPEAYVPAAARAGREPSRPATEVADLYARYEATKRKKRVVDFDDLLWWCGDALETDDEFSSAQRWRFRHLFVDEFQDVSPAQLRLIRGWLGERSDLTVVGDPDQAIFSFTGADPGALTGFMDAFRTARVVRLDRNYRSTPQVVAAAEALLADAGRPRPVRTATRATGPAPTITAYDDDTMEAQGVAARLRELRTPTLGWSAFAVLYRTNAQSAAFEAALGAAGIPARVRGDARFLDRPEVRAAFDQLRAAAESAPGATFADHLGDLAGDAGALDDGDDHHHDAADEARREHAAAVARLGREYLAAEGGTGSIDGFVAWVATALRGDVPTLGGDAVELLTFHRSKGLEFHTVFVTGLERGLVPISHADTPPERAEERRLLYVALTRAEEGLHLSWSRRRALGTRVVGRAPSPWLAPIEAACSPDSRAASTEAARRRGTSRARSELDDARDRIANGEHGRDASAHARSGDAGPEPDPTLLEALVEWRRNLARASSVPAYVIFHDSTLRTVAALQPTTRPALLEVAGVGPVKVERYGDAVLDLVRAHARGTVVAPV
jgi:DNA helicase-2/ATP-dependent DNA helicase PcrA